MLITEVGQGWLLVLDVASGRPYFDRKEGRACTLYGMAQLPEGREVYRETKRALEVATREWGRHSRDAKWVALSKATEGLEFALKLAGRWDETLKDTGVPV
jgi:hypothetical protein